jgi:predicted amino acid racemase
MTAPRIEVRLDRLEHNARVLVERLGARGIEVSGVTKAVLGSPEVAAAFLAGGVVALADSRIANVERLRDAGSRAPVLLIRSPMPSEVDRVVRQCQTSVNTEPQVITALSDAAGRSGTHHGIVLMVELGDLREGILPKDLEVVARHTVALPHVQLEGIGTNLACRNGVVPDDANMAELSRLAASVEASIGRALPTVSAGNSANVAWALAATDVGRVNHLRIGEAILLGCEPLERTWIDGLWTDAFTIFAEVIESKVKPSQPWGTLAQTAFGERPPPGDGGNVIQTIVALGRQDVDAADLTAAAGATIVAASSDHLVLETVRLLEPGTELAFRPGYSALLRAMTSPFVRVVHLEDGRSTERVGGPGQP